MGFYGDFDIYNGINLVKKRYLHEPQTYPIIHIDECTLLHRVEGSDDNIWESPEVLEIYTHPTIKGFGVCHEIPEGYSEYTYDPDTTMKFYIDAYWEWFWKLGLTEDQRKMLHNVIFNKKADEVINGK